MHLDTIVGRLVVWLFFLAAVSILRIGCNEGIHTVAGGNFSGAGLNRRPLSRLDLFEDSNLDRELYNFERMVSMKYR